MVNGLREILRTFSQTAFGLKKFKKPRIFLSFFSHLTFLTGWKMMEKLFVASIYASEAENFSKNKHKKEFKRWLMEIMDLNGKNSTQKLLSHMKDEKVIYWKTFKGSMWNWFRRFEIGSQFRKEFWKVFKLVSLL